MKQKAFLFIALTLFTVIFAEDIMDTLPPYQGSEHLARVTQDLSSQDKEALEFIYGFGAYAADSVHGINNANHLFLAAGDKDKANQILGIVEEPRYQNYWSDAYHALGMMASVEPSIVDYERLVRAVEKLESDESINHRVVLGNLGAAYRAINRHGNEKSLEFFKPRVRSFYWEDKRDLSQRIRYHDLPDYEEKRSAAATAVYAFDTLGEDGGVELLRTLIDGESDKSVLDAFEVTKNASTQRNLDHKADVEIYQRLSPYFTSHPAGIEGRQDDNGIYTSENSDAPEGVEQPEPVTEEPAEVATPKPSEEPSEQSSQWWLWLIGVLVAIGGVVLLRPKK